LIQCGELEILQASIVQFAEKAISYGVKAQLEVWKGMVHTWHVFSKFPPVPEARDALHSVATFIRRHALSLCE
jgi:acetyl esterase/lipase